ncbi:hypothetical protein BTR23_25365 [Alkalihalophilus pseudofirmus]|nr:hypothetical protein BTR23_25365 [Alkalihalophilus pseudofirmus]
MNYYQYVYRNNASLNIIKQLLTRESTAIITFDFLMVIADTEESKQLLAQIIQVRRENDEQLKWLYYQLAGEMIAVDQDIFERPETYKKGIKRKLERQQRRVNLLSRLYREVTVSSFRLIVENILVEEKWVQDVLVYLDQKNR